VNRRELARRLSIVTAALSIGVVSGRAAQTSPSVPAPVVHCTAAAANPSSSSNPATVDQWAQGAQLLPGLGNYKRTATAHSDPARQYFDQGLRLIYAFNHDEAARSFAHAVQLDPHCALCWWGLAEALGPNYNMPAMPERWPVLWNAVQTAQREALQATPVEQALINALAKRYSGAKPLDEGAMRPFNVAYADAMRVVAASYPNDDDVQVFFAEALMTANPWKLWTLDGKPSPGTPEIVATLEKVLARDPTHPGANHYYIHAVEASSQPARALAAADRLPQLMPAAGHIVHMPAHIYQRVGKYAEASAANEGAVKADLAYQKLAKPPAYSYYGMYLTHNYQFLAYSAAMEGRAKTSLDAAQSMLDIAPREVLLSMPGTDWVLGERYFAELRFGRWDAVLAEKEPAAAFHAQMAAYDYARAVAFAATGHVDEAKAAKAKLDTIVAATPTEASAGLNKLRDVLALAQHLADARIASAEGHRDQAIASLREAVKLEDQLAYDEPADWFFPVRQLLGAELLAAGKAAEAETVYREDLQRMANNGWSLRGLQQALLAQKQNPAAAEVGKQLQAAWKAADVMPKGSVF
jgi:hypothetical protein